MAPEVATKDYEVRTLSGGDRVAIDGMVGEFLGETELLPGQRAVMGVCISPHDIAIQVMGNAVFSVTPTEGEEGRRYGFVAEGISEVVYKRGKLGEETEEIDRIKSNKEAQDPTGWFFYAGHGSDMPVTLLTEPCMVGGERPIGVLYFSNEIAGILQEEGVELVDGVRQVTLDPSASNVKGVENFTHVILGRYEQLQAQYRRAEEAFAANIAKRRAKYRSNPTQEGVEGLIKLQETGRFVGGNHPHDAESGRAHAEKWALWAKCLWARDTGGEKPIMDLYEEFKAILAHKETSWADRTEGRPDIKAIGSMRRQWKLLEDMNDVQFFPENMRTFGQFLVAVDEFTI